VPISCSQQRKLGTANKLAIVGEQFLIKLLKSKSTEQNWVSPSRTPPSRTLSLSLSPDNQEPDKCRSWVLRLQLTEDIFKLSEHA
jgi:hypothetical protein